MLWFRGSRKVDKSGLRGSGVLSLQTLQIAMPETLREVTPQSLEEQDWRAVQFCEMTLYSRCIGNRW